MNTLFKAVLTAGFMVIALTGAKSEEDWTKSKYGPDDTIGAANLLTPERVLAASKLIKTGKTYQLGPIVDRDTPAFGTRSLSVTVLQPNQIDTSGLGHTKLTYNDDLFTGWLGIGPQLDGLGHIGIDHVYYNGLKASDFAKVDGLTKLGLENVPPIVSRVVVLDMTKHFGQDIIKEGTPYTREDIQAVEKAQGVSIEEGDVVLFHSGWLNLLDGENPDHKRYVSTEPGLGLTGADYLIEKNVVAVGADTWGMEVVPFEEGAGVFEVHQKLITKNGIYILENMDTREMVKDGAYEALFVLGHARVKGTVQMIINPVAIR